MATPMVRTAINTELPRVSGPATFDGGSGIGVGTGLECLKMFADLNLFGSVASFLIQGNLPCAKPATHASLPVANS